MGIRNTVSKIGAGLGFNTKARRTAETKKIAGELKGILPAKEAKAQARKIQSELTSTPVRKLHEKQGKNSTLTEKNVRSGKKVAEKAQANAENAAIERELKRRTRRNITVGAAGGAGLGATAVGGTAINNAVAKRRDDEPNDWEKAARNVSTTKGEKS
jgi:hypothetical protein